MTDSELFRKGAAMRRQLWRGRGRQECQGHSEPMMTKFLDVATETVFGALWTGQGSI